MHILPGNLMAGILEASGLVLALGAAFRHYLFSQTRKTLSLNTFLNDCGHLRREPNRFDN